MEAKVPLSMSAPLIESTVPHVTYSASKPLADFTSDPAILAKAIHGSILSTLPIGLERDFYFDVFNTLASLNQQEPRTGIDTLGDLYLTLLKDAQNVINARFLYSWDRLESYRLGQLIENYYTQTYDAAILFQNKYTAQLEEWFQKLQSEDFSTSRLAPFLLDLADLDFPQIQNLLDRYYAWNVARLIKEHRQTNALDDLKQLRVDHAAMGPKVNHYLEPLLIKMGAEKKDAAIEGDNTAYQFLLDESKKEPIMMYWLGRYYEDYKGNKLYALIYPTYALNCYEEAGKKGSADAYYQLGQCYENGKLVIMSNVEKALFYYHLAARLTSAHAIARLKEFTEVKNTPRVRVLSCLYLAMYTELTGSVSQYYENDYLKEAIKIDKPLVESVIGEISYNDEIDIHLRIALLQLSVVQNPQSIKSVASLRELFGYNTHHPHWESEIISFIQKMITYINPYVFTDMTKLLLTDFLAADGPYMREREDSSICPPYFQISMGCVAAYFITNFKHDVGLKDKLANSARPEHLLFLKIETLLKKNHASIDSLHFSTMTLLESTPPVVEGTPKKSAASVELDNAVTSVKNFWTQGNAFLSNLASRVTSSSSGSAAVPTSSSSDKPLDDSLMTRKR